MSRGYGIIQRRIVGALSKPDACTSTHVLCQTIYGDQYFLRPTKTDPNWGKLATPAARHRIAIARAAKKLQASGFPIGFIRASSGRAQGRPLYFYRTDCAESRERAEFLANPRQTA
jgi:hypothetical protein